jgi:hypothetical protein
MTVLSCTADAGHWTPDVIKQIEEKAKRGITFRFYVGPGLSNVPLASVNAGLPDECKIEIFQLEHEPPYDLRRIDDSTTFISSHADELGKRNYNRTFGNRYAVEERAEDLRQALDESIIVRDVVPA